MSAAAGAGARIGPGALIAVVGPSGAGKDTLIALARTQLAAHPGIVFPHRIVTRQPTETEAHESLSEAAFESIKGQHGFAFSWEAHGLKYALAAAIDADIRGGRTVVCNVSRTLVPHLRARYACVRVVLVTAPRELLVARLAGRARASDGDVALRLNRAAADPHELSPDVVIENVGTPQTGAARLCDAIGRIAPQL
ncbi:MAG: phosphonate metabolism protein/1,5-bisphosphokinase (PRPP-forming) PhnN [Alphaproteobacteria bacterium]|nr:phosphonate metabolism protein/1,5-bisphosphokinase (PRPP-forming) PhnN [Alphaproteobacteria bacterium]